MATTLVDTHALLWWLTGSRRLPKLARDRIADGTQVTLVSSVSAWEISIKKSLGKLDAPEDLLEVVEASGLSWISIDPREAYEAGRLPLHHRDPFDRLLVAQAKSRSALLISGDEIFDQYSARRIWSTRQE